MSLTGWVDYLCLSEILLTVRFVVLLLHERNPGDLTLFNERLDVHGAQGVATDAVLVLKYKAVLGTQRQQPSHQPVNNSSSATVSSSGQRSTAVQDHSQPRVLPVSNQVRFFKDRYVLHSLTVHLFTDFINRCLQSEIRVSWRSLTGRENHAFFVHLWAHLTSSLAK